MGPTMGPTMGPIKIPYWICLNSWGYNWGTSGFAKIDDRTKEPYRLQKGGYFWILRGTNECSIEENVVVGQPDLENITYPGVVEKYGWGLPSPSKELVQYIEQRDLDTLPNGMEFIYNKSVEGGSTYLNKLADKKWEVTSMKEPSPYTLFWFDRDRPIFCLGKINDSLDAVSTDDIIMLDSNVVVKLKEILVIQRNPLIVINDEQLQVSQIIDEQHGIVNVLRAVNNSIIMNHDKGSEVKVIPFHNLSVPRLRGILPECPVLDLKSKQPHLQYLKEHNKNHKNHHSKSRL
jgi:hypothetical protein